MIFLEYKDLLKKFIKFLIQFAKRSLNVNLRDLDKLMNDINIEDYKKYLEEYMFLKDVKNFNL